MNSNRNVLRSTQNRCALQEISTSKTFVPAPTKTKFGLDLSSREQQENVFRPILTATRSLKKRLPTPPIKTREELEEDLFVL